MSNVRDWVVKGPRRLPPINFWFTAPCVTVWGLVRWTTVVSQADSVEDVRPAGSHRGPWGQRGNNSIFPFQNFSGASRYHYIPVWCASVLPVFPWLEYTSVPKPNKKSESLVFRHLVKSSLGQIPL